ncbi:MAG: glycosyltransferase family 4 protein [Candidatus Aminicenantia bacterium]
MKVHQLLTSLTYGDAISDEAIMIKRILEEQGIESHIFSHFYHPRTLKYLSRKEEFFNLVEPEDVIIFHFSISSPISKLYRKTKARKMIIYHNITPFQYFIEFQKDLAKFTYFGRAELKDFIDITDLALGDSEFNRKELEESGYRKTGVLPIIRNFDAFENAKRTAIDQIFSDGKTNILFVGRIIPNKCVHDLIKSFRFYKREFNPSSRLLIVGEYAGFERYYYSLLDFVRALKLEDVYFTGHVTFEELVSFYRVSDLFVILSEHEGFCVPIIESFYMGIPVVAYSSTAVPETMNGAGVLIERKDPEYVAKIIDKIVRESSFRKEVIEKQKGAFEKYKVQNLKGLLLKYIEEVKEIEN